MNQLQRGDLHEPAPEGVSPPQDGTPETLRGEGSRDPTAPSRPRRGRWVGTEPTDQDPWSYLGRAALR